MSKKIIRKKKKKDLIYNSTEQGYRPVWKTGRAAAQKRIGRITGINRPSV